MEVEGLDDADKFLTSLRFIWAAMEFPQETHKQFPHPLLFQMAPSILWYVLGL